MKGIVFNIQRFSLHDGPGIRTTVFLKGCPLRCQWCHNPESQALSPELMLRPGRCIGCAACVAACAQGAAGEVAGKLTTDRQRCRACGACVAACCADAREMMGQEKSVSDVMAEIERDIAFFDQSGGGVTFSGGEPLFQPAFLQALLEACKAHDIHTTVDTCGFASWETLDAIRPYVDLFLYDLKLMDDTRHRHFTGVSNRLILSNLQALAGRGQRIQVRTPIVPGINDDDDNLRELGAFAAALPALEGLTILPYHQTGSEKYASLGKIYELTDIRPPSDDRMAAIAATLAGFGLHVKAGG